jgi:hypothetical protein
MNSASSLLGLAPSQARLQVAEDVGAMAQRLRRACLLAVLPPGGGNAISDARRARVSVTVVAVTDGEASHPRSRLSSRAKITLCGTPHVPEAIGPFRPGVSR